MWAGKGFTLCDSFKKVVILIYIHSKEATTFAYMFLGKLFFMWSYVEEIVVSGPVCLDTELTIFRLSYCAIFLLLLSQINPF
jgi:hypothetical protein